MFGRCAYLQICDTERGTTEVIANPGAEATGGSGVQAAQVVVDQHADLLVAPKVGPQAHEVLVQAGMRFLFRGGGTVGEALEEARKERLD